MNIVSIDFDIIMKPSIECYNNIMMDREAYDPMLLNNFHADLTIYKKLTEWLIETIQLLPAENIIFIDSHEQIIKHIPMNEQIYLINIDHHHDMGYRPEDNSVEKDKNLHCGNWAKYLLKEKLINEYIWICNENSQKNFIHNINFHYISEYNLNNLKANKIIICLSSPWIPNQFRPLFYTWMSIIATIKNTNYFLT